LEGADCDYETLLLLVAEISLDASDEGGDGHCLAARVEGVWKLGDGTDAEVEGPGYQRVSVH
jgi:hypothetical protein